MAQLISSFSGSYQFLSNFYMQPVLYAGITYRSVEHAFQAVKAENVEDHDLIANSLTPGDAKRNGKSIILRQGWDRLRDDIMYAIVYSKFSENQDLQKRLLATGDATLIEGNTWGDQYWGVCKGRGLNKLGYILMRVREELRDKVSD